METEIGAGKFKTHCLELLDTVNRTRAPLIITKRGKPVAKLVPMDQLPQSGFGAMKGSAVTLEDVIAPIDVKWDALS